ncbi:MAG: hypothetical protein JW838_15865 [Spirochaetes bacterium]|nr:hypothetical protein [Spirochaetota bacterium]
MKKRVILMALLVTICICHCKKEDVTSFPQRQLKSYSFNAALPLGERLLDPPSVVIEAWKKFDKREDYMPHRFSVNERMMFTRNLKHLPPLNKKILEERLIGFYFIDNFLGSAAADWVLDENKKLYFYIIFNPKVLTMSLSEVLTWREQSCFIPESGYSVEVDCGKGHDGILYALLHETTHVVDYTLKITPYVEKEMVPFLHLSEESTGFVRGIWKDIGTTEVEYAYRKNLAFYGLGGGPKIHLPDAEKIYREFCESPFVSLYGSMTWAEDIADMVTFYHLTEKMHLPYAVRFFKGKRELFRCDPMEKVAVRKRLAHMERFYF